MSKSIFQSNPLLTTQQYASKIQEAIQRVLDSGCYILGKEVEEFENEFADYLGAKSCIGVGSGTDAMKIGLASLSLTRGDKVILPSHTATGTLSPIIELGLEPIFADIEPDLYTLAPESVEEIFKSTTNSVPKAVIAVHLYGGCADLTQLQAICDRHGAHLIEDCAQALGARMGAVKVGTFGTFSTHSFYPTKNLGALGDGGAVTTQDLELGKKIKQLREYGWSHRFYSEHAGYNSRLDEIQAAVLRVKLAGLEEDNAQRQKIARLYFNMLKTSDFQLPIICSNTTHVFHQYVIQTAHRKTLREALRTQHIGTGIHYPTPLHLQPAFQDCAAAYPTSLTHTEQISSLILSLPIYPQLLEREIRTITTSLLSSIES